MQGSGIFLLQRVFPKNVTENEVLERIEELNKREEIHGIILQLPLLPQFLKERFVTAISSKKDVDGFHPKNRGLLDLDLDGLVACTPLGVLELLEFYEILLTGKHAVILGRSHAVGHLLSILLLHEDATVTVCHSRTQNLKGMTRLADILVLTMSKPHSINADYIKEGL